MQVINLQAKNLETLAKGEIPEIPIDPKVWKEVLNTMELMPKFKTFEAITLGVVEAIPEIASTTGESKPSQEAETLITTGNAFEEVSKKVKARLNGKTAISPKTN